MTSWVCLDSGVALKLVLNEEDSLQAKKLWQALVRKNYQPTAPQLFSFEITSVLRLYDLPKNIYEIGFHIRFKCWRHGYAYEAALGVMAYAFNTLNVAELFAG